MKTTDYITYYLQVDWFKNLPLSKIESLSWKYCGKIWTSLTVTEIVYIYEQETK